MTAPLKPTLLLLLLVPCVFSCSKKDSKSNAEDGCNNYSKGTLTVGIKNQVKVEDVFATFNALHLQIAQMTGFSYTSAYSADSIPSLDTLFSKKPYVNVNGFHPYVYADFYTRVLTVSNTLWNMDAANQQDWIGTAAALKLTQKIPPAGQGGGYLIVAVPVGQEKFWLKSLEINPIVSWANLDCLENLPTF